MAAVPPSEANSPSSVPKDDDSQDAGQPNAKKRRTGATSRGVANLTPEQLARKRAIAVRGVLEENGIPLSKIETRIEGMASGLAAVKGANRIEVNPR